LKPIGPGEESLTLSIAITRARQLKNSPGEGRQGIDFAAPKLKAYHWHASV